MWFYSPEIAHVFFNSRSHTLLVHPEGSLRAFDPIVSRLKFDCLQANFACRLLSLLRKYFDCKQWLVPSFYSFCCHPVIFENSDLTPGA